MPSRSKTVRFAHENTIYYPSPAPLAFASSISTATPPTRTYSLPVPRASQKHHVAHIHHQSHATISVPHRYFAPSSISWDLRDRPSTITRYQHHLSSHALNEPATSPPTDFLRIIIPSAPWSIKVYPTTHGAYVRVSDVLDAIYTAFRTNVRSSEFAQLSSRDQSSTSAAYQERYRRLRASPQHYDEEKRAGMKRVDFLMGQTRFVQLVASTRHPDQWTLVIS
ncbi:hypothetical protein D9619_012579 [Psilocybe cf. subviscida]|uniref:DUF6699 domain-containing protein n=1 Tax=Psilocybe cf. subviscida TaxID=2480587 RepID=A0A8H5B8P2_9AGAR|nr:hypothetical protein D9619_012579 [Psilocybe cf. subviscida]